MSCYVIMSYMYFRNVILTIASAVYTCLYSVLQKRRSIQKSHDGVHLFHQPHIHSCFQRIVLCLRNMFKFLGHSQFLEICATSKETMLFHDNGFVVLRFACGLS